MQFKLQFQIVLLWFKSGEGGIKKNVFECVSVLHFLPNFLLLFFPSEFTLNCPKNYKRRFKGGWALSIHLLLKMITACHFTYLRIPSPSLPLSLSLPILFNSLHPSFRNRVGMWVHWSAWKKPFLSVLGSHQKYWKLIKEIFSNRFFGSLLYLCRILTVLQCESQNAN